MEELGSPAKNLVTVGFGKRRFKNDRDPFADENRRVEVMELMAR